MDSSMRFDYYYGAEAEQFSFYRVPRLLIKDGRFKGVSSDAKLLYGLMLDRMSLSMKNGWFDERNRAYIYYTLEDIMEDLGCARATCVKVIGELDSKKGIGLIEKKRQGLGKPDRIYVKHFVLTDKAPADGQPETLADSGAGENGEKKLEETGQSGDFHEVSDLNVQKSKIQTSRSSEIELQDVQNPDFQKFKKQTSGGSEIEPLEVQNSAPNYTDNSYTDGNYNNPIIQSGEQPEPAAADPGENREDAAERKEDQDVMGDVNAYMEIIKENIEYDYHMKYDKYGDRELYEELYLLICEVVCVKRPTVKINGADYPYELVKAQFLKLNGSHLQYVMGCMKETTTEITNIRAYLITALYNASCTIHHYFKQAVQHDMYGGGWSEKGIV